MARVRYVTSHGNLIWQNLSERPRFDSFFNTHTQAMDGQPIDQIYNEASKRIDEIQSKPTAPIQCKKGCSACCHLRVDLTPYEENRILHFLDNNPRTIDTKRLDKQMAVLRNGQAKYQSLSFEQRKCVFLDEQNECSIYEVRPLSCKRYNSNANPINCQVEDFKRVSYDVNSDHDAFLSALVNKFGCRPLPQFVYANRKRINGKRK